jgi:ribonuclease E
MLDEPTSGGAADAESGRHAAASKTTSTRRTRRGAAGAEPPAEAAPAAAPAPSASAQPTAAEPAPRSRRRTKAVPADSGDVGDSGAKPRAGVAEQLELPVPTKVTRTRRRGAAEPASGERTPEPAPTRPAVTGPAATPAVGATEQPEAGPTRTRRRATKATRGADQAAAAAGGADATAGAERSGADRAGGERAGGERAGGERGTGEAGPSSRVSPTTAVIFMAPPAQANVTEPAAATGTATPTRSRAAKAAPAGSKAAPAAATGAPATVAPAVAEEGEPETGRTRRRRGVKRTAEPVEPEQTRVAPAPAAADEDEFEEDEFDGTGRRRRRRGRRGRGRGKGPFDEIEENEPAAAAEEAGEPEEDEDEPLTRRRRRRRRRGAAGEPEGAADDGVVTVVKIREPRAAGRDEVQGVSGSTRLEAKRQRRRDGREQRRTRPPILSESEFLARREAVDRVMVVRQKGDRTQVAVLEDGILVEHYVTRQSASTMVGNVYLGKVQNVLPSMEAAFVDIGRGRNAVLYAGEVNWDASGLEGRARSIEHALKSGESVLVQVTKDPIGHKGARLTSHVALSGRHLVYVPNGHASGISRKLSDVERRRLRDVLKNLIPDGAGVIVRTAAEGAAEDDLERDVKRLQSQWDDIQKKVAEGGAPVLLYSEPDLVIRVVRDLFNEDFRELVIQGTDAYDQVEGYLSHVSPDLVARVRRHAGQADVFAEWRVDEQILKGLDRKVYLPSGGHLVIDRTEAMTVIDVNTGKYTGAGGNLEETVTRNNLEAAEEIVRQLRLRDLGGIVVIDFIDMVLESNRELVLRRLTECLGRDRTKHQVTEITSLGLVQMTRKRIGQGLLESFSETCEHCKGRGVLIQTEPTSDRPRNNVAEKVRAVAASARVDAVPAEDSVGPHADGMDLDESAATDMDELLSDEEATGSSVRRRVRRGTSRRRTRP